MLIEFKVTNYRSIRAEQTLSMVASNYSDELPQNLISCDDVPGMKGTKLVKAVALYGANASGKSNIVSALRFFAEFVRDSATKLQPGAPTGAQPFKLDPACLTEPSKFEITAVINGVRTLYGLELTRERVTSEYLVAYPKGRPQVWFERDWNEEKEKYDWSKPTAHFRHDAALLERTRENAAFLSVGSSFNHQQLLSIYSYLSDARIIDVDRIPRADRAPDCTPWFTAQAMLAGHAFRDAIVSLIAAADFGITDVSVEELDPDPREIMPDANEETATYLRNAMKERNLKTYRIRFAHRSSDSTTTTLDLDEQSGGTIRFYSLLGYFLVALIGRPSLLIVDELDANLSSVLFREVIEMFFRPQASQAQLIFTTHNPLILDHAMLRRDQIWFTEKDQEGATRLYPLTDFKPRKDESLVKGYLGGRYGGIPFIPEGLKF